MSRELNRRQQEAQKRIQQHTKEKLQRKSEQEAKRPRSLQRPKPSRDRLTEDTTRGVKTSRREQPAPRVEEVKKGLEFPTKLHFTFEFDVSLEQEQDAEGKGVIKYSTTSQYNGRSIPVGSSEEKCPDTPAVRDFLEAYTGYVSDYLGQALSFSTGVFLREAYSFTLPLLIQDASDEEKQNQEELAIEEMDRYCEMAGAAAGSRSERAKRLLASFDTRYKELLLLCQEIGRVHATLRKEYEQEARRQHKDFKLQRWALIWEEKSKSLFPQFDEDLLPRFAADDPLTSPPSEIAYAKLAREIGKAPGYVKQLVKQVKHEREFIALTSDLNNLWPSLADRMWAMHKAWKKAFNKRGKRVGRKKGEVLSNKKPG